MVRRMYHDCKLVHADLSEYNLLVHDEHLYVIDVSQSVEHDHPSAYEFLRNDIRNVEEFFVRRGVKCLGIRSCFEFVTKENLGTSNVDANGSTEEEVLQQWLTDSKSLEEELHTSIDRTAEANDETKKVYEDAERHEAHEDAVFLRSFIPRTLNEVYDPERDIERLTRGQGDSLIYNKTIGVVGPLIRAQAGPHVDEGAGSDRIEMETPQFAGEQLDGDPQEKQLCQQESDSEEDTTGDDGTNPGSILDERKPRGTDTRTAMQKRYVHALRQFVRLSIKGSYSSHLGTLSGRLFLSIHIRELGDMFAHALRRNVRRRLRPKQENDGSKKCQRRKRRK